MDPLKIPIRASTQDHLEIEDIRDNFVILRDGGAVLVITTTAINFGLLSEKEQDAIIFAYAAMINSLTFSLQLVVRSQKKDVSGYLHLLDQALEKEAKEEIKEQIRKYKVFISEIVAKNEVLDKKFFLAIPMTALEIGAKQALGSSLHRRKGLPFTKEYILEKARVNLLPKKDHLLKQLARLGLKARQLTTPELIQLFFEIYNPDNQRLPATQLAEYQTPMVRPGVLEENSPPDQESPAPKPQTPQETAEVLPAPPKTDSPPADDSPTDLRDEIHQLVTESSQNQT